jgi:hypothetical protein
MTTDTPLMERLTRGLEQLRPSERNERLGQLKEALSSFRGSSEREHRPEPDAGGGLS